jgi:cation diffusion facilitator CzcD-associated flavoprotein CzcO
MQDQRKNFSTRASVDSDIYDVIIIGGGLSALAVAARLREPLYTHGL